MFVDFQNEWFPSEPPQPLPPPPRNERAEKVTAWIIGFNLVMLLVGPLAGATLFDAVAAMLRN
ncbi:hypothetical protein U1872_14055 [Sphingomonas sp. RB3P16]|uniref:hypothetical protein n=1 Tax=Parasphingomonas frigoris TaxID=3096163 RepID=UPI002FC9E179